MIKVKTKKGTESLTLTQAVDFLKECKKAYYSGKPLVSDDVFDDIEDQVRKVDPINTYFDMVGYTDTMFRAKISHGVPMRSMQKGKSVADIERWLKNTFDERHEMIVEPKIDGMSATIHYENGRMQLVATRKDGDTGYDVTGRAKYIPSIPRNIIHKEPVEIRGEIYLAKNNTFSKPGEPLRNIAVGLMARKDGAEDCKHLSFVAYEVVGNKFKTIVDKITFIKDLGFESFSLMKTESLEGLEKIYWEYIDKYRDEWLFETDGLILQPNEIAVHEKIEDGNANHPKWAIAWKPPSQKKDTEMIGIDWRVTRFGTISPTAVFKPVEIMGTVIQRATLHNLENVRKLKLNRGDKIIIERANDVIPQVVENRSRQHKVSLLIPEVCPSCSHKVIETDVHLKCPNEQCRDRLIDKIVYWVVKSEMDQISESTVLLLYENDLVKKISDLYNLKADDMEDVKGLGESKIKNILAQVNKTRTMTAPEFLNRLGIPSVGKKQLAKLGIKSLTDFRKFHDNESAVGRAVIEWKKNQDNMAILDELSQCIDVKAFVPRTGKTVCFTGSGPMGRKQLAIEAEKKGYIVTDSVNSDLDLLVCDDVNGSSSKLVKARKNGTGIMTYEEFFK